MSKPMFETEGGVRASAIHNDTVIKGEKTLAGAIDKHLASGATAGRPASGDYVGQQYYDTTVGKPCFWDGSAWKLADGTAAP